MRKIKVATTNANADERSTTSTASTSSTAVPSNITTDEGVPTTVTNVGADERVASTVPYVPTDEGVAVAPSNTSTDEGVGTSSAAIAITIAITASIAITISTVTTPITTSAGSVEAVTVTVNGGTVGVVLDGTVARAANGPIWVVTHAGTRTGVVEVGETRVAWVRSVVVR